MDHNEILKHVKALYEYNQTSDKLKNELVIAFPELREFEDEDMIRYIGNAITCKESAKYLEEKGIDMIKAHRWLESFKPQLKQEWSEEDKKRVNRISDFIWKNRKGDTDEIYQQEQDVNWIKSIKDRVQTKEWTEEDESMYTRTLGILGKCYMGQLPNKVEDELKWLKSLNTQKNLKQICSTVDLSKNENEVLKLLYNELREKFKGESIKVFI